MLELTSAFLACIVNINNIEVNMRRKLVIFYMFALILVSAFPPKAAHADVAPPEAPPGTNLIPGNETTQVRMAAETVTLTISKDPSYPQQSIARTEAVFTMRNLGMAEEKMQVRFPLSFFNGNSDGFGNFPEIGSIAVKVNGQNVPTRRENQPFVDTENGYKERAEIPWALFDVSFPPNQDVTLEVVYTVNGYGYYPYDTFKYILETGAGWNGTIGSADIIVHMPYEVSDQNIWMSGESGYGVTTPGGVLSGNELRWHFADLEPTSENNIQVVIVTPSLWETVLKETDAVTTSPNDGEAWGRLAKAYKEIARMPKGYLRDDPAGRGLFELSRSAYERCFALLPKDSLWQYGYAELLWSHYYFDIYMGSKEDAQNILPLTLMKLQTALALDPNNQRAKDLLAEISYAVPDAVRKEGDNFIFLGLTATPIHPTPYLFLSETPQPTLTDTAAPTQQAAVLSTESAPQPAAKNPLCGSAFLLPALFGFVLVSKRRK